MKTPFLKELSSFIPIFIGIFTSVVADAQIVYTDVNPDITQSCLNTACNKSAELDLNNDGIMDFTFNVNSIYQPCNDGVQFYGDRISITPLNSNFTSAAQLPIYAVIDSNILWSDQSLTLLYVAGGCYHGFRPVTAPGDTQDWTNGTEGYLALKIIINSQIHYGWVRLSMEASFGRANFTIEDYGYNGDADQPILASQGSPLAIADHSVNINFSISPNPLSNTTTVSFYLQQSQKVIIQILDMNGRSIKTLANDAFDIGEHSIICNSEKLNTGIYLLQIKAGESVKTAKLIVAK